VSLLVQWKRPEVLVRPPPGWHGTDGPYYRFAYRAGQRDVLEHLENALAPTALVVYGSPAVPDAMHLETAQVRRRVLALTHFVPPSPGAGHDAWTYREPRGAGYPNESGPPADGDDFRGLIETALGTEPPEVRVAEHLQRLRPGTDGVAGDPGIFGALADQVGPETARVLEDLLMMSVAAAAAGASWWLCDLADAERWLSVAAGGARGE
jgi:hypothetical protein